MSRSSQATRAARAKQRARQRAQDRTQSRPRERSGTDWTAAFGEPAI